MTLFSRSIALYCLSALSTGTIFDAAAASSLTDPSSSVDNLEEIFTTRGMAKKAPKGKKQDNSGLQRLTFQARTTIIMPDDDELHLTPAETIFFEDTWLQAFQTIQDEEESAEETALTVRSVIVEDADDKQKKNKKKKKTRNLRASSSSGRELWFYNFGGWFDILAYIELSCVFCGGGGGSNLYDDDDDRNYRDTDDKSQTLADDDSYWGVRGLGADQEDKNNDFRRRFETTFCDMLRDGPFESFQRVQDCEVTFPIWGNGCSYCTALALLQRVCSIELPCHLIIL